MLCKLISARGSVSERFYSGQKYPLDYFSNVTERSEQHGYQD